MSVGYAFKPVFEQFDRDMTSWLYGEWSKEKVQQFELLKRVPVLGDYMDWKLDIRQDEEYLNRLNDKYNHWIENIYEGRVLVVDKDVDDFVADPSIIDRICASVEGMCNEKRKL